MRKLPPARGAAVALVLIAFSAGTAAGQNRPLLTEPALTARAGTLVFETGVDAIAAEPSHITGVERKRWDGPLLRLVYSPADNVELDLEWVARVGVWNEAGREVQGSDWGDVSVRAKWRILSGRPGRPTLGARFGVMLPQTPRCDAASLLPTAPGASRSGSPGRHANPAGRSSRAPGMGIESRAWHRTYCSRSRSAR